MSVKSEVRQLILARRAELDPDLARRKSEAIGRVLSFLPEYRLARTLLLFVSFRDEVNTGPLIRAALREHKRVAVPKVLRPPRHPERNLLPCAIRSFPGDLTPGAHGILEPPDGAERPVRVEELDLVVVPGVAFTPAGDRLGYGGGFYDRFLPTLAPGTPTVGLCFDLQLVESLPREPHDHRVSAVVTEKGVIRPAGIHPPGANNMK